MVIYLFTANVGLLSRWKERHAFNNVVANEEFKITFENFVKDE